MRGKILSSLLTVMGMVTGCRVMIQADLCGAVPFNINEVPFAKKRHHRESIPRAVLVARDINNNSIVQPAKNAGQSGLGERFLRVFTFPLLLAVGFLVGALVVAVRVRAVLARKSYPVQAMASQERRHSK